MASAKEATAGMLEPDSDDEDSSGSDSSRRPSMMGAPAAVSEEDLVPLVAAAKKARVAGSTAPQVKEMRGSCDDVMRNLLSRKWLVQMVTQQYCSRCARIGVPCCGKGEDVRATAVLLEKGGTAVIRVLFLVGKVSWFSWGCGRGGRSCLRPERVHWHACVLCIPTLRRCRLLRLVPPGCDRDIVDTAVSLMCTWF